MRYPYKEGDRHLYPVTVPSEYPSCLREPRFREHFLSAEEAEYMNKYCDYWNKICKRKSQWIKDDRGENDISN